MSTTFACPHCGATYPVKPVLVGRPVRCTACKKPFRLRADGIADPVVDEPPPPADPGPTGKPDTARSTRIANQPQNAEQRAAQRKTLAANLASAANAALADEAAKAPSDTRKMTEQGTKRKAKEGSRTGMGAISPASLSDYGVREHRNNLMWLLGAIGTVAIITALVLLSGLRSPQRRALERYTAPVESRHLHHGGRLLAIQDRAWLSGAPALIELGRLRLGQTRALPMTPLKGLFSETLAGLSYLPGYKLWAPRDKNTEIEKLWNSKRDHASNLERLTRAKLRILPQPRVIEAITAAGWSEDDAELLMHLLTGKTNGLGENWIATKLFAGDPPERIEICPFTGSAGSRLIDLGRTYTTRTVDYQGLLLRFVGQGWPDEWKVLEITTTEVK